MPYSKRSDYRTMPLPEITEEFKLAVDHLMVYDSATLADLAVASGLTADLDKLDKALRWLVTNKFVRYTNERYTRELRLRGLERRIWPKERPKLKSLFDGLTKSSEPNDEKPKGPRLLLLQTR